MRIGELAARAGVKSSTIRFYEREGLLVAPQRTESGYRTYDEAALATLSFIVRARDLGLTLAETSTVLAARRHGDVPCDQVRDLIERRVGEIDDRVQELLALRDQLALAAKRAAGLTQADCSAESVCHIVA